MPSTYFQHCLHLHFDALHADPEKIIKGDGYWNSTLVGETEEQSGEKPRLVIVKLKVPPVHASCICTSMHEHLKWMPTGASENFAALKQDVQDNN